eukprot:1518943-Pleurochrysis_carterae.AAC.1
MQPIAPISQHVRHSESDGECVASHRVESGASTRARAGAASQAPRGAAGDNSIAQRSPAARTAVYSDSSNESPPSATYRLRQLARVREKERAALAAERADLEFLCDQDYVWKLERRQEKKVKKEKRQR